MFWRKCQGIKLKRLAVAFGAWMDAADKKVIKSKGDLVDMIKNEIRYKHMNGEKPYIYDILEVMKYGSEVYNGCLIDKLGNVYLWKNLFKSENLDEVKKYIDEALLSLNKSIKS